MSLKIFKKMRERLGAARVAAALVVMGSLGAMATDVAVEIKLPGSAELETACATGGVGYLEKLGYVEGDIEDNVGKYDCATKTLTVTKSFAADDVVDLKISGTWGGGTTYPLDVISFNGVSYSSGTNTFNVEWAANVTNTGRTATTPFITFNNISNAGERTIKFASGSINIGAGSAIAEFASDLSLSGGRIVIAGGTYTNGNGNGFVIEGASNDVTIDGSPTIAINTSSAMRRYAISGGKNVTFADGNATITAKALPGSSSALPVGVKAATDLVFTDGNPLIEGGAFAVEVGGELTHTDGNPTFKTAGETLFDLAAGKDLKLGTNTGGRATLWHTASSQIALGDRALVRTKEAGNIELKNVTVLADTLGTGSVVYALLAQTTSTTTITNKHAQGYVKITGGTFPSFARGAILADGNVEIKDASIRGIAKSGIIIDSKGKVTVVADERATAVRSSGGGSTSAIVAVDSISIRSGAARAVTVAVDSGTGVAVHSKGNVGYGKISILGLDNGPAATISSGRGPAIIAEADSIFVINASVRGAMVAPYGTGQLAFETGLISARSASKGVVVIGQTKAGSGTVVELTAASQGNVSAIGATGGVVVHGGTITGRRAAIRTDGWVQLPRETPTGIIVNAATNYQATNNDPREMNSNIVRIHADSSAIIAKDRIILDNALARVTAVANRNNDAVIHAEGGITINAIDSVSARGAGTGNATGQGMAINIDHVGMSRIDAGRIYSRNGIAIRSRSDLIIQGDAFVSTGWGTTSSNARLDTIPSAVLIVEGKTLYVRGGRNADKGALTVDGALGVCNTNTCANPTITTAYLTTPQTQPLATGIRLRDASKIVIGANNSEASQTHNNPSITSAGGHVIYVHSGDGSTARLQSHEPKDTVVRVLSGVVANAVNMTGTNANRSVIYIDNPQVDDQNPAGNGVAVGVSVSGGNVVSGHERGRAITILGHLNVHVTGGRVVANGTDASARGIYVENQYRADAGEITIEENGLVEVVNGTAVWSKARGRILVTDSASVRATNTGTGIRTEVPATGLRSVTVNIGGTKTPTNRGGAFVTATHGTAINAADTVRVWYDGNVSTVRGTAISAAHVRMTGGTVSALSDVGTNNTGGSSNVVATAIAVTGGARVTGGTVTAGRDGILPGEAANSAALTGILVTPGSSVLDTIHVVGCTVQVFGAGTAIQNAPSGATLDNVVVIVGDVNDPPAADSTWILAGNNGRAISSRGTIIVESDPKVLIRAGDGTGAATNNAIAISATGSKAVHILGGNIEAGVRGVALSTGANVGAEISGGRLTVEDSGSTVVSSGTLLVTGGRINSIGETGTAVNARTVTFRGGIVDALDMGVVSTGAINIHNVADVGQAPFVTTNLSGTLRAGSEGIRVSRNAELAITDGGRTLRIPQGQTLTVNGGGRFYVDAAAGGATKDTLVINGTVNSRGAELNDRPTFENVGGHIFLGATGNIIYHDDFAQTFRQNLTGSSIVLHKGGQLNTRQLTTADYKRWADTLTTGAGGTTRGITGATAVVPPVWDNVTATIWGVPPTAVIDTVAYSLVDFKLPLNADFTPYAGDTLFSYVKGNLPVGMKTAVGGAIEIDSVYGNISGLLTQVGNYVFTAKVQNQAGTDEKEFRVIVGKATMSADPLRLYGEIRLKDGSFEPIEGGASVQYTGKPVQVNVRGDSVSIETSNFLAIYEGFGLATLLYASNSEGTVYPMQNIPPSDVGNYRVLATINGGANFNAVSLANAFEIGTFDIEPAPLEEILTSDERNLRVTLPFGTAIAEVSVPLPSLERFISRYNEAEGRIQVQGGTGTDEVVRESVRIVSDSVLVFGVNDETELGDVVTIQLETRSAGPNANIEEGGIVTVNIVFTNEAGLTEPTPVVGIDFVNESLIRFEAARKYTLRFGASVINVTGKENIPLDPAWIGNELEIVSLAATVHRFDSPVYTLAVPARRAAPADLDFVADSAQSNRNTGAILHVDATMRYRKVGDTQWTNVTAAMGNRVSGLEGGDYEVQFQPTTLAFESEIATIGIPTGIAEQNREINIEGKDVAVITPVRPTSAQFTAGPNPVAKSAGSVAFFWQGQAVASGSLKIFDAAGNLVRKVSVTDNGTTTARREIGSWNMTDSKGRAVADGTYMVTGTLKARDGSTVKVSYLVGVR